MVWWWWIIPGFVAVIGLAFALSGLGWMFRGRPFKGGRGVLGGGVFLGDRRHRRAHGSQYSELPPPRRSQRQVATISFEKVQGTERTYDVTLTEIVDGAPGGITHTFQATGDDWMMAVARDPLEAVGQRAWPRCAISARSLRQPLRDIATHRTERRAQRLRHPPDDRNRHRSLAAGAPSTASTRRWWTRSMAQAAYMPMADGAAYRSAHHREGLIARPTNEAAAEARRAAGM